MGPCANDRAKAKGSRRSGSSRSQEVVPGWNFRYRQNRGSRKSVPEAERFWSKVKKTPTCWVWLASRKPNGYGQFEQRPAHHWIGIHVLKLKVDHKMVLDHKCRNRLCVRPDHLRLVTARENLLNSNLTWVAKKAAQTHCLKAGHPLSGKNLYLYRGRRYCRACRIKYATEWHRAQRKESLVSHLKPKGEVSK